MASLALAFDILARDKASATFNKVGDAADKSGRQIDKAGDTAGRSGRKFGGIGVGVAAAGAAVGAAAVGFGAFALNATNAFAAVEDATGAASVQFGKALPQVLAFADKAGKSFGLSRRAAIEAQNTFGTLGKSAGLAGKPLADFSGKFAGLAGDLASFKGTSTEQAIQAVGAALRGEAEPIRAYGVLLDDASLRQEALALGLITTTKTALTPQNKVLATQALIYKQTGDAQGDYARTSDSTANTQKTLAAATEDARAALGEKLAPTITAVRKLFLKLVEGAGTLIDKFGPGIATFVAGAKQAFDVLFRGDFKHGPFSEDSPFIGKVFEARDALGRFADKMRDDVIPQTKALLGKFRDELVPVLTGVVLPAFKNLFDFVKDTAIPRLKDLAEFVVRNKDFFIPFVGVLYAAKKAAELFAVAQLLVNGALLANPIGVTILAVAAFVGALVVAYNRSETFRQIVTKAFEACKVGILVFKAVAEEVFRAWVGISIGIGKALLTMVDVMLSGFGLLFSVLGRLPGKFGEPFRQAGQFVDGARGKVDTLKAGLDVLGQKIARPTVQLMGADGVLGELSRLEAKLKNTGGVARVYQRGGNTSGDGPGAGGPMLARISRLIAGTGLSVSSTYRTPARNAAIGGSPSSYHLDRSNPAVDVVGPAGALDRLQSQLRSAGGLRELLWRVPGHFDHLHAADQGGIFKGPGLVKMGPGYETFASGLRPAQKVADLPSGNGSGVTMNYYGDVHTVDVDEFTRKQTARMRDLIAVGGLA